MTRSIQRMGTALACGLWLSCGVALGQGQLQGPGLDDGAATLIGTVSPVVHQKFTHEAVVKNERMDAFHRAWRTATEARRDDAAEVLASLRSPGAPSEMWPDAGSLEVAMRALDGEAPELLLGDNQAAALAVQAASLDLRVTPGHFTARGAGRGESLVVRVSPLFELREALDVTLRLIWISPTGEEQEAREEVIRAEAFRSPGFDMYIRSPVSPGALWTLVAELRPASDATLEEIQEAGDDTEHSGMGKMFLRPVRSYGITVPAVANMAGVRDALLSGGVGFSPSEGATLGDLLTQRNQARMEATLLRLDSEGLRVSPLAGLGFDAFWQFIAAGKNPLLAGSTKVEDSSTQRIFVRVAPGSEAYGAPEAGIVFEAWQQLGKVINVAPAIGGIEPVIGRTFTELASVGGDVPERILVLRGDALMASLLEALRHGLHGFDRLVIVANSWRPSPLFPEVPTLFLTPNANSAKLAGAAAHVTAETLPRSVFLSELDVPGLVAKWLDSVPEDKADSSETK